MNPYDVLAPFYDDAILVPPGMHDMIRSRVARYRPAAHTVCELGCGTGNILIALAGKYRLTGVDESERMLERARRKVPGARFFRSRVDAFTPPEPSDVVLFMYDGLNHTLRLEEWEALFARVVAMLHDDGLFIFDVVTPEMLQRRREGPPIVTPFGTHLMVRHFTKRGNVAEYNLHVAIFEHAVDQNYVRHEVTIPVASFPVPDILRTLRRHFRVRDVVDPRHDAVSERTDRVYFIAQKSRPSRSFSFARRWLGGGE